METNEIVKLILSDNKELSKSKRFYNLSLDEQVNVIISQRPELKNCFIGGVVGRSEQFKCDCGCTNHYKNEIHDSVMCVDCGTVYARI